MKTDFNDLAERKEEKRRGKPRPTGLDSRLRGNDIIEMTKNRNSKQTATSGE